MSHALSSLFGFTLLIGIPIAGIALVEWMVDNTLPPTYQSGE